MKDQYVEIPPELMGKADPDQQWIEQQLDRIDPHRHEQGRDYADEMALRVLVLELRKKLAAPKPDTSGPAFPCTEANYADPRWSYEGMTLRDYFAAKAMQAALMTAKPAPGNGLDEIVTQAADAAYKAADAMLKARAEA